jgi:MoaA/NifB/PqqE/SkfB family radical SAM enzyme
VSTATQPIAQTALQKAAPVSDQEIQTSMRLRRLPLVTLYLTERCNSRCITCDYWRTGRSDVSLGSVKRLLPSLTQLQTRLVLISGGEPLVHPEWVEIAQLLGAQGLQLWLLTSGLSLGKHAPRATRLFNSITVSLDGTDRPTYAAIRGLDAFDNVCAGIQACAAQGAPVGLRVTVQRSNYEQLPRFVSLARQLGARQVSFLAVDVANPHAFGRSDDFTRNLALRSEDLRVLEQILRRMEQDYAAEFRSGFIAESPRKLRHLHQYFAAMCGLGGYPPVKCNAPEFSAVIGVKGEMQPCFFISGPKGARVVHDIDSVLNSDPMMELRQSIRAGERDECTRCVCSMYRDPVSFEDVQLR